MQLFFDNFPKNQPERKYPREMISLSSPEDISHYPSCTEFPPYLGPPPCYPLHNVCFLTPVAANGACLGLPEPVYNILAHTAGPVPLLAVLQFKGDAEEVLSVLGFPAVGVLGLVPGKARLF